MNSIFEVFMDYPVADDAERRLFLREWFLFYREVLLGVVSDEWLAECRVCGKILCKGRSEVILLSDLYFQHLEDEHGI